MNRIFMWLILPALLTAASVSVQADSFTIADGDVAGLKAAITTANSNGQDNVINLAPGTYTLMAADNVTNGPTGLPVVGSDSGHSITIYGHYATITRSSSVPFRILQTAANSNVVLDSVIIRHGLIADFYGPGDALGGGIYNAGTLTLTNSIFESNRLQGTPGSDGTPEAPDGANGQNAFGGAIYSSGQSTITGCFFTNNSAVGGYGGDDFEEVGGDGGFGGAASGGAIYGAQSVVSCVFNYNTVTSGDGGYSGYSSSSGGLATGGALNGTGAISRSTFTGNSATPGFAHSGSYSFPSQSFGGAIAFAGTISENAFSGNSAQYGGALSLVPDLFEHGVTAVVTGCFFQNNSASIAGGVAYVGGYSGTYGDLLMTNCTISACTAPDGAAIYSRGIAALVNCTLDGNTSFAEDAGSLEIQYDMSYRAPGPISLTNSIIKTGTTGANVAPGGIISLGHNISSDKAAGLLTATGDMPDTDPGFVADTPQDNGGHTKTIALGSLSPAINAGDDAAAPHRDQRGLLRAGRSDIGAYEYLGSLVGLSSITLSGNDVTVSAEVVYGHRYQLEWKSNLTDAEWVYSGYDFTATDNDVESATGFGFVISLGDAFYRLRAVN